MIRKERGSILFISILAMVLVSGLILVGTDMHLRFAREARSVEDRLKARHIAFSAIAYIESQGSPDESPHPFNSGFFRFSNIQKKSDSMTLNVHSHVTSLSGVSCFFDMEAKFKKVGAVWKCTGFAGKGPHP